MLSLSLLVEKCQLPLHPNTESKIFLLSSWRIYCRASHQSSIHLIHLQQLCSDGQCSWKTFCCRLRLSLTCCSGLWLISRSLAHFKHQSCCPPLCPEELNFAEQATIIGRTVAINAFYNDSFTLDGVCLLPCIHQLLCTRSKLSFCSLFFTQFCVFQ